MEINKKRTVVSPTTNSGPIWFVGPRPQFGFKLQIANFVILTTTSTTSTMKIKTFAAGLMLAAALCAPSGAPPAAAQSGGTPLGVQGYIFISDYWDFVPEWTELTSTGYTPLWTDPDFGMKGEVALEIGWVRNERLCGYCPKKFNGMVMNGYFYKEYNLTTGAVLTETPIAFESSPLFVTAAYNPDTDEVVGLGTDTDGSQWIMRAPASDPTAITKVALLSATDRRLFQSMTWNASLGTIVGINKADELMSLDPNGSATKLGDITGADFYEPYYTGLCYDATSRCYYWNVTDWDESHILRIDASTLETSEVSTIQDCGLYSVLWCGNKAVSQDAPGEPEFLSATFEGPSPDGTATFRLPTLTSSGNPLEGTLDWTSTLDGQTWSQGTAQPGQTVTAAYASLSEGEHTLGLYASQGGEDGPEAIHTLWVGNDDPAAPAEVKLTTSSVSWQPVTEGAHGGYLDAAAVTYEVYINGESRGTTASTSLDIELDATQEMRAWQATVTASAHGRTSEGGLSNELAFGAAMNLPLYFRPTEAEFMFMTTSDDNGDGYGWHYVGEVTDPDFPCLDSDFSHIEGPADDWLFLPAANLDDAEAFYYFSMDAKGRKTQMQPYEYFEVKIGRNADAQSMTQTLIPRTLGQVGFVNYDTYFQVPEAGDWYVGIHAVSDFDMYGVRVRDIHLQKSTITADSPAAPTAVSAEAAPGGELKATVRFTMPTANVRGEAYPASATLRVRIQGDTFTDVEAAPGAACTAEMRTLQGDNKLTLTPYNGESAGLPAYVSVYTGMDRPTAPPAMRGIVSEDNMSVALSWDVPTQGAQEGWIDPAQISYEIFTYNGFYGWVKIDEVAAGTTSYTFVTEDDGGLATYRLGVNAVNPAGASDLLTSYTAVLGIPYDLPFIEMFDTDGAQAGPWQSSGSSQCTWGFADLKEISYDWDDLPGGALVGMPKAPCTSAILFPKFSTYSEGAPVVLTFRVWAGGGAPENQRVLADAYGLEAPLEIGTIAPAAGWTDATFTLPDALLNRNWIQIRYEARFATTGELCVIDSFKAEATSGVSAPSDGISVISTAEGIEITAPAGTETVIYSPDGICLKRIKMHDNRERVALTPGFYFITAGGRTYKIRI